ncbi:UNVERIFIED_ORG: hypothetical protein J2W74_005247 [Methylorubrum zatmanii]
MLDPVVESLVAEAGGAASLSVCETHAAEHYSTLLQRFREAHALSGQMVACLEAGDLATFATLCGLYTRTNSGAGEALVCLDAVRSSEGSA